MGARGRNFTEFLRGFHFLCVCSFSFVDAFRCLFGVFFLLPIETFVKQPSFLVSDDLPFSRRLFFPNSHTNFQEDYDHVIRKLRKK